MLDRSLGNILIENSSLTEAQLEEGLIVQKEKGLRLGEALVQLRFLRNEDILKAVSIQLDIPYQNEILPEDIPHDLIEPLPINYAKKNEVIPLKRTHGSLKVAIADPVNIESLDDLRLLYECPIIPVMASSYQIMDAINAVYNRDANDGSAVMDDLDEDSLDDISQELEEPQDLLESDDEAPIIRLVNSLLFRSVKQKASDIHIEPFEKELAVRFRIDGVLYDIMRPAKKFQNSIISRIKIMANLNIAEKRLPQDGRIRIKIAGKDIDIRVSSLPTSFGESVVMRLLDKSKVLLDIGTLGFREEHEKTIDELIHRSHGIILVTGPTGSGKTTTLYGMLSSINTVDRKIITIEDPVEYQLTGINQIQVNAKIELTFAAGLRSILRQDPDVVMIGEIRDKETAEIAIQASLTGHLVISTLHTNDAVATISRLIDMGVEPFLLASSLGGIIAQRLIRTVCKECRVKYTPSEAELMSLGDGRTLLEGKKVYKANPEGCSECIGTGYSGRMGIHEILTITDTVRGLIMKNEDSGTMKKVAMAEGLSTLRESGIRAIALGKSTVQEVLRVTQEDLERTGG